MALLDEQFLDALADGDSDMMHLMLMENRDPFRGRRWIEQAAEIIADMYKPDEPTIMLEAFLRLLSPAYLIIAAAKAGNVDLLNLVMTHYYYRISTSDLLEASVKAARNHQINVIQWMIDHRVDLHAALDAAARKGYRDMVHVIINAQPGLDLTNPTLNAVKGGHLLIVQDLVDRVGDPERIIFKAADEGQANILDWLLYKYPDVLHDSDKVLIKAIKSADILSVKVVLNHSDLIITDEAIKTAFLHPRTIQVGKYLLQQIRLSSSYLIELTNKYHLANLAITLIRNGVASVSDFTFKLGMSHLRELIQAGIEDFPGYENQVEETKRRLEAEASQLDKYLPNVLSRLSIDY